MFCFYICRKYKQKHTKYTNTLIKTTSKQKKTAKLNKHTLQKNFRYKSYHFISEQGPLKRSCEIYKFYLIFFFMNLAYSDECIRNFFCVCVRNYFVVLFFFGLIFGFDWKTKMQQRQRPAGTSGVEIATATTTWKWMKKR